MSSRLRTWRGVGGGGGGELQILVSKSAQTESPFIDLENQYGVRNAM